MTSRYCPNSCFLLRQNCLMSFTPTIPTFHIPFNLFSCGFLFHSTKLCLSRSDTSVLSNQKQTFLFILRELSIMFFLDFLLQHMLSWLPCHSLLFTSFSSLLIKDFFSSFICHQLFQVYSNLVLSTPFFSSCTFPLHEFI